MNVPNIEKKAFRDMTAEERSIIVEALLESRAEILSSYAWEDAATVICTYRIYRTKSRKIEVPWEHVKPEFKWAAMDQDGEVFIFLDKPNSNGEYWYSHTNESVSSILNIDISGIDWRESLTQRPENSGEEIEK